MYTNSKLSARACLVNIPAQVLRNQHLLGPVQVSYFLEGEIKVTKFDILNKEVPEVK